MLEHYIEYLYMFPGTTVHKTVIKEISERDPSIVSIPYNCTGFRFFDRDVYDGNQPYYLQNKQNVSGWYFCNCEKITLEDATKVFCDTKYYKALKEYAAQGAEYVVKTKSRHFIPLRTEDTVI